MSNKSIAGIDTWARVAELSLRWARRWRSNSQQADHLFKIATVREEFRQTCRDRIRENALLWRSARRERRSLMGLPDIGGGVP